MVLERHLHDHQAGIGELAPDKSRLSLIIAVIVPGPFKLKDHGIPAIQCEKYAFLRSL